MEGRSFTTKLRPQNEDEELPRESTAVKCAETGDLGSRFESWNHGGPYERSSLTILKFRGEMETRPRGRVLAETAALDHGRARPDRGCVARTLSQVFLIGLLFALAGAGSVVRGQLVGGDASGPYADESSAGGGGSPSQPVDPSTLVPTDPNHILRPQDTLRVKIFQEDDLSKQCDGLVVSQQLKITLPLIGTISVRGKTIAQTREMIRSMYDKDFLVNPQIAIQVIKYGERSVNVLGSVTKQGKIDFPDTRDLSIVDAIALAGGQTRLADLEHVRLTRQNDQGESATSIIDVEAMTKKGGPDSVMLQPGDIVYVPERIL